MLILASPAGGPLASFTDEFDSTLNSRYTQTTGSWSISSGDLSTSTAASSYPLITFNARTREVTVKAEPGTTGQYGWGVAFWVTDANNWWAVIADQETFQTQTGTTTVCNACGSDQCGPDGSCNCFSCDGGGCIGNCTLVANAGSTSQPVYRTDYRYVVRLIRRNAGTVSTVSSATITEGNISSTLTIGYVQASINTSGQITATGQMSTGGTVATITNTPSTPTKTFVHGAIVVPKTAGTQGTTFERYIYSPA